MTRRVSRKNRKSRKVGGGVTLLFCHSDQREESCFPVLNCCRCCNGLRFLPSVEMTRGVALFDTTGYVISAICRDRHDQGYGGAGFRLTNQDYRQGDNPRSG